MSMSEVRKGVVLPQVLAIDFDGTLVEDKFPEIGEINRPIWDAVLRAQKAGSKLILWTCRNGDALKNAVAFCAEHGLLFDAINENLPEVRVLYGNDTRKVFADVYIDDRIGVLVDGDLQRVNLIKNGASLWG